MLDNFLTATTLSCSPRLGKVVDSQYCCWILHGPVLLERTFWGWYTWPRQDQLQRQVPSHRSQIRRSSIFPSGLICSIFPIFQGFGQSKSETWFGWYAKNSIHAHLKVTTFMYLLIFVIKDLVVDRVFKHNMAIWNN